MRRGTSCLFALVIIVGCKGDGLNLAPAEGVVTLDGQPVADAGVMFLPVSPKQGPAASGATDQQGRFTMMTNNREGAPVGDHRVSINKADPFGVEIPPEQLENADFIQRRGLKVYKTKHHLPPLYSDVETSNLTATVEDKRNVFEFKLNAK